MCGHHDRFATKLPVAYARTGHKRVPAAAALRQSALRVLRAANRRGCGRRHHRIRLGRETTVERGGSAASTAPANAPRPPRIIACSVPRSMSLIVIGCSQGFPRQLRRGAGGGPAAPYFLNRSARCARSPVHGTPGLALGPAARHDARVRFSSVQSAMATLPGLPQTEEPEPDALPVEPDDGTTIPGALPEPGHEPVDPPRA